MSLWQFLFLVSQVVCIISAEDIVINTDLGQIRGTKHTFEGVYSFYGIPFATPPVGSLRFRQAQLNESTYNGIYDATKFSPVCMQYAELVPFIGGNQTMDEDCLYLNIWTSKIPTANDTKLLPVMFWIYGGGFTIGSGSEIFYDGLRLVSKTKDFIYVNINYRLGIFGFLQNEQLLNEDPNFRSYGGQTGVYDQIVALQWVKKHIHSYGGDPNQITIFGESAGGLSVCNLIISPLATGLFNRGIIESGACTSGWSVVNTSYGLTLWDEILSSANLPNNVTFLRTLSSTDLNNAVKVKATKNWQGSVDGLVLTDTPYNIYSNLDNRKDNVTFNVEKLIIGFNSMDGVDGFPWHLGPRPTTADELDKILAKNVPNEKQRNELENKYYPLKDFPPYPPGHDSYSLKYFTITADCCLICPTLNMAENINKQLKNGDEIVYIYLFGGPGKNGSYYAPHASELPFVFNIAEEDHMFDMPWDPQLSERMISAWTNFGIYGIPNITNGDEVDWEYFSHKQSVMVFEDVVRMEKDFATNYRSSVCEYWYNTIGIETMSDICNERRQL